MRLCVGLLVFIGGEGVGWGGGGTFMCVCGGEGAYT